MKRKFLILTMMLMTTSSIFVGCGKNNAQPPIEVAPEQIVEEQPVSFMDGEIELKFNVKNPNLYCLENSELEVWDVVNKSYRTMTNNGYEYTFTVTFKTSSEEEADKYLYHINDFYKSSSDRTIKSSLISSKLVSVTEHIEEPESSDDSSVETE